MTEPILNARIGRVRPAWTAEAAHSAAMSDQTQGERTGGAAPARGVPPRTVVRGFLRPFVGACLPAPLARYLAACAARWAPRLRGRPLTPARARAG